MSENLQSDGLKQTGLIFGVDFTASNKCNGYESFDGRNLHDTSPSETRNPYVECMGILGEALQPFLHGQQVLGYGFGDATTRDQDVFPIRGFREPNQKPLHYHT